MSALSLLLVFELRVPFGVPADTIASYHEAAWQPLLDALFRANGVRVCLSISGAVLDWMAQADPDTLASIREMVDRGQLELLGGPRHDTVVHSVPARDIQGQVAAHSADLEAALGQRPRGMLLPQGAWDPVVPRVLARTEMAYTFLDQRLIRGGGCQTGGGWYVTEREGQPLALFPTDPQVRLFFPWGSPKQLFTALYQRMNNGQELLSVVVPASRLGAVPGSLRRCWDQRWVFALFRGLRSQSAWLKTVLPTEVLERQRPSGRVYPCAGVPTELVLSGLDEASGRIYERLTRALERGDDPVLNDAAPWLLGPPWEAALTRHDAANRLHKYMLRVSSQVARLQKRVDRSLVPRDEWRALCEQLYQGQGALALDPRAGLRDGRIRHAAWLSLTLADHRARTLLGRGSSLQYKMMDSAAEGEDAVEVVSSRGRALVRPVAGGSLSCYQLWGVGNLVNTFARQRETWFSALETNSRLPSLVKQIEDGPDVVIDAGSTDVGAIEDELLLDPWPTPPDLPPIEGINDAMLTEDRHRRLLFQDHFLGPQTSLANLVLGQHPEDGDFLDAPYQLIRAEREDGGISVTLARDGLVTVGTQKRLVRIDKRYHFQAPDGALRLEYQISNRYQEPIQTRFGVELNLNLDGVLSSSRYLLLGNDRRRIALHRVGKKSDVSSVTLCYADLGASIQVGCSEPATVYFFPVFSPVRRDTGYDRGHQGTCILLTWPLKMWGSERKRIELTVSHP